MSTQILSFDLAPFYIQSGYGIPNHFSTLGSEYTDLYTTIKYVNKNGLDYWVEFGGSFNGGTVSGATNFTGGLSASTISATTYLGLPSFIGDYLPLSGGTVSGGTSFTAGLTANTLSATSINKVDNIIFNTGTTSTTTVPGTVYFDNTEKALSYNTSLNQGVTVNLGQQNYLRVFNNSGLDIQKGKAIELLSSYSGLPAVTLAVNRHYNDRDVVGVSAEIIPNNSEGIVLTYGIISNITVTGASVGSLVYASDTNPGEFKNALEFNNFPLTARTNAIGYIIQTGTTTGKLFVNPVNENNNLSLTDLQRNILEGNVISTGVFTFGGISLASSSTFNVGPAEGWIVDNTSNPLVPDVFYVKYTGQTNIPSLYYSSATQTYLLLTSAGTLTQQVTYPTPQQRRQSIYLAKMGHGNRTSLINAFNEPDFEISPISQIRDMFTPIKLINENVYPSPNTDLTFNTSSGILWGLGIGFATDVLNPSSITISGNSPTTFQYRTQTGGTATNRTTIDPANYDLNGVITTIGSPAKQATNQRIYLLQNGQIRIQYGQTKYADLTSAIAAVTTESFKTFSNFRDNAILIAILSVRSDASLLSDVLQAKITFASKFGESVGGTGGISTTNLQQAYNNSAQPEIVTNSAEGALSIKNGTGNANNVSNLFEGFNDAGTATSFIRADGVFSGVTFYAPTLYSSSINNNGTGGLTITGNQSLSLVQGNQNVGRINIGTSSAPGVAYNDGRTITSTSFIGNATPLSGSNWNYNQIAIETVVNTNSNSSGKFRGIYINPSLTMGGNNEYFAIEVVTGKTILDTLSASSISATTYQNLPIKYYAEFSGSPSVNPSATASNSIAIGSGARATASDMFVVGQNAGSGATGATYSNFIGQYAGSGATTASYCNFIGQYAGWSASTNSSNSNFLGFESGYETQANSSNFLGYQAGKQARTASSSNFFGFRAGAGASNASNSVFIGTNTGSGCTQANNSIFIGQSAGRGAASAYHSIFIGYQAGYNVSATPSFNNIIIGNNVSLSSSSNNKINIGGVLFGSGTYNVFSGNASISAQTQGRIGINVVDPTHSLHVIGDTRLQGGLTANTISATTTINSGTKTTTTIDGSNNESAIVVSGGSTVGGAGYVDFIKVTNTSAGATNINKTIRINSIGAIEFINSTYTGNPLLSIADNGIVSITSPASVTSNSATNNAFNIGSKGQLFDDGNFHIHSSSGPLWINALDGSAIRLGTQTNTGNSTVIVDTTTVGHSFFTKVQSGFDVAFGTEISMDNLKVRINGTGASAGLVQAGAVSGSFAAYTTLLGNVAGSAVQGDTNSGGITFTTTYQNISGIQKTLFAGGDTTTLHLIDTTNSRIYRITAIHCQSTTGGYTSIERMA